MLTLQANRNQAGGTFKFLIMQTTEEFQRHFQRPQLCADRRCPYVIVQALLLTEGSHPPTPDMDFRGGGWG
jgi:hypothetical protein